MTRGQDNVESCASLETQINPLDPGTVLMSSTEIRDCSELAQNRYKLANESSKPSTHHNSDHQDSIQQIETVHNTNLAANMTSSCSLTTADTTKGSDFGNHCLKSTKNFA